MEDGSNGPLGNVEVSECTKNGVVSPIMANFPEGTVAVNNEDIVQTTAVVKVNGENHTEDNSFLENENSSGSDALVIDEGVSKLKIVNQQVVVSHSNPFFNESLFELSEQHKQYIENDSFRPVTEDTNCKVNKSKRSKGGKTKPKLREYAQYLGLQPTVQFKCSKCGLSGFESLSSLNDHIVQCNEVRSIIQATNEDNQCSGFKLTRKVFLCSACGTYYENWNLYMHMLEFHRRYICLYCLGMFSVLEDLCQHIQVKHNLEPGYKNTLDEFFNTYNEPCYIVCCECNKLFSEQDNFFYHNCIRTDPKGLQKNKAKPAKTHITPENHVTGDSGEAAAAGQAESIDANSLNEDQVDKSGESREQEQNTENSISIETNDFNKELTLNNKEPEIKEEIETEDPNEMTENKSSENIDENNDSNLTNCTDISREGELENFEEEDSKTSVLDDKNEDSLLEDDMGDSSEPIETRKVPKLSLKLPKPGTYPDFNHDDSNDSYKLTLEVDQIESENENEPDIEKENEQEIDVDFDGSKNEDDDEHPCDEKPAEDLTSPMRIAGSEIPIIELELEQPLDKFDIRVLLQKCLKTTTNLCVYCNHARKIAVNGHQLGLHAIAEHRFSAVVNSITAEELIPESFVMRIKESLPELENIYFNLESSTSDEAVTFSHLFECFQCRYSTTVHKELYLHNRKMHAKNLLLCIMCKSNFYSYSELICHLCPGEYVTDIDLTFRCCMCVSDDLPSAFRLLVHMRKKHHVCDVCLEMCHNQYRLSNHVWKHKLHHFCYRCGIAYRNKPDITRHLFWKHGTESVLCKRCLQKKWPHVYHFCVPPATFTCEECNLSFSKAVALKVHKRLHTDERPHSCTIEGCTETFISKKLLNKHEERHRAPPEEPKVEKDEEQVKEEKKEEEEKIEEKIEEKPKPKIDVYDLPALNLSESDSSDSEEEMPKPIATELKPEEATDSISEAQPESIINDSLLQEPNGNNTQLEEPLETDKSTPVIENIWEDFKNYQANKDKMDQIFVDSAKSETKLTIEPEIFELTPEIALKDHDYCIDPERKPDGSLIEVKPDLTLTERVDHDYCSPKNSKNINECDKDKTQIANESKPRKRTHSSSSDSSSGSGSSSCSCGSNCSCSSSSGSSSSSSDSSDSDSSTEEGRRKQIERRERRKNKEKNQANENKVVDVVATDQTTPVIIETPILESDLCTTESETDEEFYDKKPQLLAKKILEEKRNQLLAEVGTVPANGGFIESTSRPPTPPGHVEEEAKPKKKSKSKKRKKKKSERKDPDNQSHQTTNIPVTYYQQYQSPTVAPLTLSLSRNSPLPTYTNTSPVVNSYPKVNSEPTSFARRDSTDSNLRASKRRRVPNKFYGYSSDEEDKDKSSISHLPKFRRTEATLATPRSPLVVPPITIKTIATPRQTNSQPPPIEPISIRSSSHPGEMRIHHKMPPIRLIPPRLPVSTEKDSGTDSNDSDSEDVVSTTPKGPNQPQLYCYCRCPYDEVSEMIGCDSSDCAIEWFHFECVGIMVPPKGQWFCPDCRKKKQMRREMLQT